MDFSEFPQRSLVLGFDGIEPDENFLKIISDCRLFGIIFFARNFQKIYDITKAIELFHSIDNELEFLIDQEGGEKCRIVQTPYCPPEPWSMRDWQPRKICKAFKSSAEALAELGITINLAPVADLGTGDYIRKRTFGKSPQQVAERVASAVKGILAGGSKPCAKHFPGLGSAHLDPHIALPVTDTSLAEFQINHWLPFKSAIEAGCPYIMTTHLLASSLDPNNCATYSSAVVKRLRNIGFTGKILSDDLAEMKGASEIPTGERIQKALDAGHNIALWCKT